MNDKEKIEYIVNEWFTNIYSNNKKYDEVTMHNINLININELDYIYNLYYNDEYFFKYFTNLISKYFKNLDEWFIDKYADKLNWKNMLVNEHCYINYNMLEKYKYNFNLYEIYLRLKDDENIKKLVTNNPYKFEIDKLSYEMKNEKEIY